MPDCHVFRYYNYSGIGKHSFGGNASSLAALEPIINAADEAAIAAEHGRRLQTLLSVDDIVGALNAYLVKAGEWENTFFITASDHGYSRCPPTPTPTPTPTCKHTHTALPFALCFLYSQSVITASDHGYSGSSL